jgi:hypothetical protein
MIHPKLDRVVGGYFENFGPTPGDIAVEIELEGMNLPKSVPGWNIHSENSLRGDKGRTINPNEDLPDTPREYVTAGVATLAKLRTDLTALNTRLSMPEVAYRITPRASTHFHVNMSQELLRNVFGYYLVFSAIEPVLLKFCGAEREGNLFCIPIYESGDLPQHVEQCLTSFDNGPMYWPGENHRQRGKYASLNTDPLSRQGSLEVRCFPNSIDTEQIMTWAQWLVNIRTIASSWGMTDYSDLLDHISENKTAFLQRVFQGQNLWLACGPHNPGDLVDVGIETAYETYRAMLPALEYKKPEKKKKYVKVYDPDVGYTMQPADDPFPEPPPMEWEAGAE